MEQLNEINSKILVVGIGNYLMGDEGAGIHAVQQLSELPVQDNIVIVDGGTDGLHLLEYFEKYKTVILVDAALDGNKPGTIRLIEPESINDFSNEKSIHDIGLKDIMTAFQLQGKTPDIYLFVISVDTVQQQGIELSNEIEAILPELIGQIVNLVWDLIPENGAIPV